MNSPRSTPAPTAASLPKNSEEPASPEADAPANDSDNPTAQTDAEDAPAKAAPPKKTLSKTAPDPSSRLRRQR